MAHEAKEVSGEEFKDLPVKAQAISHWMSMMKERRPNDDTDYLFHAIYATGKKIRNVAEYDALITELSKTDKDFSFRRITQYELEVYDIKYKGKVIKHDRGLNQRYRTEHTSTAPLPTTTIWSRISKDAGGKKPDDDTKECVDESQATVPMQHLT